MSEKPALLPVYLIVGEDELKREHLLERLRNRMAEMGDTDLNTDVFTAENATGSDIVTACNTLPFLGDVRCVLVKGVDALKKDDAAALAEYLESPCETTVLVLIGVKLAKNTKLYKAVEKVDKKAVLDCTPKKRYELPKHVRSMAVSHGITITATAAEMLVELVGENTVHLDAELKKLAVAHQGKNAVSEKEVLDLVSQTAEARPWEFVNAFGARDIKQAMDLYYKMDSISPFALLGQCVTRVRELLAWHALNRRGQAHALASYLKVPEWRVKNHAQWARKWTPCQLRHVLSASRDVERAMKSGANPDDAFLTWILDSCNLKSEDPRLRR